MNAAATPASPFTHSSQVKASSGPQHSDALCMAVQLSQQLRAVRNGSQVVSTERLAELGFDMSVAPRQLKSRSRSAQNPKPARSAQNPKSARKPKAGGANHTASDPVLAIFA